ncbi:alpha/beta hydrolase [Streptomyces daliensis]|uniref:Alpha/beta fold hydrolase n=1 Tax=Streptomyces daliensis TaxID=299421 RepID=A0A8T4IKP7_9ACTN|nr:alpha/beta fold hydrolase [Streptomyces daliensis]
MTTTEWRAARTAVSPGVRAISLDAGGITLSALLSEPTDVPPRATVVALHGGGMTAGYFDGQAHPGVSLLTLGARLGFTVLAVDRPGYGESAGTLPEGQTLAEQSATLHAALDTFAAERHTGAGVLLLAHSYGGKLALTAAADDTRRRLLGLDISGCGHRYAVDAEHLPTAEGHGSRSRNWGVLRLYPPDTFRASADVVAPMPARERAEAARWAHLFEDVAPRVRVPLRLTFAEHESWWLHDEDTVADLKRRLSGSPRVLVERLPGAGHNISLGWAARSYHLRALAFLEECLAAREVKGAVR